MTSHTPRAPSDVPPDGHPAETGPAGDSETTPRWVIVFAIVLVLLVIVFAVVHLCGGGFHGHGP